MNSNIYGDFEICISLPLMLYLVYENIRKFFSRKISNFILCLVYKKNAKVQIYPYSINLSCAYKKELTIISWLVHI